MQEINIYSENLWPEVYLIENIMKKGYHSKEGDIELIGAVKKQNPELEVLYAVYSEGELTKVVNREFNMLQSRRILSALYNIN